MIGLSTGILLMFRTRNRKVSWQFRCSILSPDFGIMKEKGLL